MEIIPEPSGTPINLGWLVRFPPKLDRILKKTKTKLMNKSAIITALALGVSTWSLTAQQPGAQPADGQSPPPQAGAPGDLRGFHLFPPRTREKLNLSVDQQKQVVGLEIDVRAKLGTILTADQAAKVVTLPTGGRGDLSVNGPDGKVYGLIIRPLLPDQIR